MKLENFVKAGYPAIVLTTPEEDRALITCNELAKKLKKEFLYWSLTNGIQYVVKDYYNMTENEVRLKFASMGKQKNLSVEPISVLEEVLKTRANGDNKGKIFVLLDFHPFIKDAKVWRSAKDFFKLARILGVTYIFVSVEFDVPLELKREVITTSLPLPTEEEIKKVLEFVASDFKIQLPDSYEDIVESAKDLTINELKNIFLLSVANLGKFDAKFIKDIKANL